MPVSLPPPGRNSRESGPYSSFRQLPEHIHFPLNQNCGLNRASTVQLEQIRILDKSRLKQYVSVVSQEKTQDVNTAICISPGLVLKPQGVVRSPGTAADRQPETPCLPPRSGNGEAPLRSRRGGGAAQGTCRREGLLSYSFERPPFQTAETGMGVILRALVP